MWIGYGPVELYDDDMSVLEMMCASVCLTSMICFSMEIKYGNMFHTSVHMNRHRVGARGNVTCFPLPWEGLLDQLTQLDHGSPALPRTPQALADIVRVLLKSSELHDKSALKKCIAQGAIRRAVVKRTLLSARARGHPAYRALDLSEMERRLQEFGPCGVQAAGRIGFVNLVRSGRLQTCPSSSVFTPGIWGPGGGGGVPPLSPSLFPTNLFFFICLPDNGR